jgi:hypothetical protein
MLTLFVVTTGEGWPGIRQNSMDTTFEDTGPAPFFRIEVALFYVFFFIVFPFFFGKSKFASINYSSFFSEHLRRFDHHHLPRTRRSRIV